MSLKNYLLYFSFLALFLITCSKIDYDNILDYKGENYIPNTGNLMLNPEGFSSENTIENAIENYLGIRAITDGTGRPITYEIWTSDTNHLAIRLDGEILLGHSRAINVAELDIQTKSGWKEIRRSAGTDTFEISWWKDPDTLWIADFESFGSRINNCGGEFGEWDRFPNDTTQGSIVTDAQGQGYNGGNCIRIEYDVESPNPALCGAFFKLNEDKDNGIKDLTPYKKLIFWVKGDSEAGFGSILQAEFKRPENIHQAERYIFTQIDTTNDWQRREIEIEKFFEWSGSGYSDITDWTKINEFTVTFSDTDLVVKEGAVFIDDIILVDSDPYPGLNKK